MADTPSISPVTRFDVIGFAKGVLDEVERTRAYDPISDDDKDGGGDRAPTESRTNTFFRLVGLPSIVSLEPQNPKGATAGTRKAKELLTPGYARGEQKTGFKIQDSSEATVTADKRSRPLRDVLREREAALLKIEKEIGTADMNTRMVKAFCSPLEPQMDVSKDNAQQTAGRQIFKRLSPFAVSFRDIFPGNRQLARPFLSDPRQGYLLSEELRRPFIETVVRVRFVRSADASGASTTDYLQALRARLNAQEQAARAEKPAIAAIVSSLPSKGELLESFVIDQMLASVKMLAERWVGLKQRKDQTLQNIEVSLVPSSPSARQSPLGKRSNRSVSVQVKKSKLGREITKLENCVAVSQAVLGLLPTEDETKSGNVRGQADTGRNIMRNALTKPFVSVIRQDFEQEQKKLESKKRQLKDLSQRADSLRLELEMMTGEFTGLSVPDVVFTMLALFLVEKSDLLALLDQKTLDEMKKDKVLQQALSEAGRTAASSGDALKALEKIKERVDRLYDLFSAYAREEIDKRRRPPVTERRARSSDIDRFTTCTFSDTDGG